MKASKSEPKVKLSLKKYENFLPEKNWKDPMYMDSNPNEQKGDLSHRMKSQSVLPKSKLSLSLHQKAHSVLMDNKKLGMMNKSSNVNAKRSQKKINLVSTLPPLKSEIGETANYLNKIKSQLNEVCLKNIRVEKQLRSLQIWRKQIKTKIGLYESILDGNNKKHEEELERINGEIVQNKYNEEVRTQMRESLKNVLISHSMKKKNLEKRLDKVKQENKEVGIALERIKGKNSEREQVAGKFNELELKKSTDFQEKSKVARIKMAEEGRAEELKKQLESIENYDEDTFQYETNLKNHHQKMRQVRAQLFVSGMMNILLNKYQLECKNLEKCYGLLKMYSIINGHENREGPQIVKKQLTNDSHNPKYSVSGTADIAALYELSFETKKEVNAKIQEKEEKVKELKKRNEQLFTKWVSKTYEDSLSKGEKSPKKKTDFSQDMKELYKKSELQEKHKQTLMEIKMWTKKQNEKLQLKGSKKSTVVQFLSAILEQVGKQGKKYMDERKIKK